MPNFIFSLLHLAAYSSLALYAWGILSTYIPIIAYSMLGVCALCHLIKDIFFSKSQKKHQPVKQ